MHRTWLLNSIVSALFVSACADDVSSIDGTDGSESTGEASTSTTSTGPLPTTATTEATTTSPATTTGVTTVEPGSSSGSTTAETSESSSGGEPELCGNGRDDRGEECDDGNTEDGDQCSSTCTIPFEVVWTETHNGETSGIDNAGDIVIDAMGNIYVVGTVATIAMGRDAWVAMYEPDGTLAWDTTVDAGLGLRDAALGVSLHTSGDLIVTGFTDLDATETDGRIFRISVDTRVVAWEVTHDGPSGGNEIENFDSAVASAVDAAGDIVVVGNERGIDENFNIWVQKYDADGGMLWADSYNGALSESDRAIGVVADADGSFVVYGLSRDAVKTESFGWFRRYNSDGTIAATASVEFFGRGLAPGPNGDLIVAGVRETASGNQVAVARFDSAFGEVWLQQSELVRGGSFGTGVAVDAGGTVFVVGSTPVLNEQNNIWIGALDADGAPVWSDSYNNKEAGLGDFGIAAAVAPDGTFVALGQETVFGQQSNIWIRKYRTL